MTKGIRDEGHIEESFIISGGWIPNPPAAMKILSWNFHGLGIPQGIRALRDVIKKEVPDTLFLQETKLRARAIESCKYRFGFVNCISIECVGRSGGVALLWKK